MKLLVAKIGANITFSRNVGSAANADILYFLRTIGVENHDIAFFTRRTRNTVIPRFFAGIIDASKDDCVSVANTADFDALIVFNGSVNFFGGAKSEELLNLYRLMSTFKGPVIYINTDGALPLKCLWPMIEKRDWAANLSKDEFDLSGANIHYITQARHTWSVEDLMRSKDGIVQLNSSHIHHYPLASTILSKWPKIMEGIRYKEHHSREATLAYGGYTRNTYRRKRLEHYYCGHVDSNVFLFGNLKLNGCGVPVSSKVNYHDFIRNMQKANATVIVGDEWYEDNMFTLRMYESILAHTVVFIDERFDPGHLFYDGSPDLQELYVKDRRDLDSRLSEYKSNDYGHLSYLAFKHIAETYNPSLEQDTLNEIIEEITHGS